MNALEKFVALITSLAAGGALALVAAGPAAASGPPSNSPEWEPPFTYSTPAIDLESVRMADLNGDSLPDFVSATGFTGRVVFWTNDPTLPGTFLFNSAPVLAPCIQIIDAYVTQVGPQKILTVLCAGSGAENNVAWYEYDNGVLEYLGELEYTTGTSHSPQVAPASYLGQPAVAWAPGDGTVLYATFDVPPIQFHTVTLSAPSVGIPEWTNLLAELEVAGVPTLAVGVRDLTPGAGRYGVVLVPNGSAAAQSEVLFAPPDASLIGLKSVFVQDFNADDLDDLLMAGPGYGAIYVQEPDGTFSFASYQEPRNLDGFANTMQPFLAEGACFADYVSNAGQGGAYVPFTNELLGEQFPRSGTTRTYGASGSPMAVIQDVNEDGRPDIVAIIDFVSTGAFSVMVMAPEVPIVIEQPVNVADVEVGETITLTVDSEPAPASVQWQQAAIGTEDWADVPGLTGTTVQFEAAETDIDTKFRAFVLTDANYGCLSCAALASAPVPPAPILPATGGESSSVPMAGALGVLLLGGLALGGALIWRKHLAR